MDKTFKAHIFTQLQMDILLNRFGYSKIYGLDSEYDLRDVSKEQVYSELADMVRMGILVNDGEQFLIEKSLKSMFEFMALAGGYIHIVYQEDFRKECICYIDEKKTVIVSRSTVRHGRNAVTEMKRESFYRYVLEEIMPKGTEGEQDNTISFREDKINAEREANIIEMNKLGFLQEELKWHAQIMNIREQRKEDIYILEDWQGLYQLVVSDDRLLRKPYEEKNGTKWIIEEIEEMIHSRERVMKDDHG